MRRLAVLVAIIALAAFALVRCTGGAPRDVAVIIAPGSSLKTAATALKQAGAITSTDAFLLDARLFGAKAPIKPGEYAVRRGMSAAAILALLQSGKVVQRFVAVYEGMPSVLVRDRLLATPLLTGDVAVPAEGSVLPDNYSYVRGERRAAVLARMQKAMQTAIANAWQARGAASVVRTPEAAITLASIVEKETGRADERGLVAAVYTNRLKRGMPLQADPTVIYPVTRGKPLGRRILKSELESDNAYNTYRHIGLPPGPITNPGKASIAAALNPAPSDVLYFVAQGDGSSAFSATLQAHNANVQKWYDYRRAHGEM